MIWNDFAITQLERYVDAKLSRIQIGRRMGCSRSAVSSAVRRYLNRVADPRKSHGGSIRQAKRAHEIDRFVEPYAARKLRLQQARQTSPAPRP